MTARRSAVPLFLVLILTPALRAANWPERPVLHAVRAAASPVVDGDLSDGAWQSAPEFTDFTQHDPDDGQPATLRTSVRIVYDDDAIYFGLTAQDPGPPTALLARRDSFTQSDFFSINIDPQHDRLSGAAFTISPSNVQVDSILFNDIGEDISWDAVWDSATKVMPGEWTAEVRIPFSQLRFPDKAVHTWGLNITRRTVRTNEWVRIVNTKKGETGFVSHFADIAGIEGIRRGRPLELVPYATARADVYTRADRSNPLLDRRESRIDGGLDLKYGLTSSLTLTGTINPDFGQVEVDPAVVNLSQFETFYPEKRPFFTEGLNLFDFGDAPSTSHFNFINPPSLFYSRRIGRSPQGEIDAAYSHVPAETTILGAAKVTGRLPNGWSIGVLDALTASEHGRWADGETSGRSEVEPMTNYFVSRMTRETGDGSRVGFMLTSTRRNLPDELQALRENALTLGVDGYESFGAKSWIFEWAGGGSRVDGSEEAIALTQLSPARQYQRPDAEHVELDPFLTSLTGWFGHAMLSKVTGDWRPLLQVQAYSPGFETNDVGFMQRADIVSAQAVMQYFNQRPSARFRERSGWVAVWTNRNFDGDTLERGLYARHFATLANYWKYAVETIVVPSALDDRLTRGGPLVRSEGLWQVEGSISSDERKRFFVEIGAELESDRDGSYRREVEVELTARPAPNLTLSVSPSFERSRGAHQFLTSFADAAATATYGRRYVFSRIEQRSFELATRVDWTLSPRLSFQLYVQPFIASGDYHDPHVLQAARTSDYAPYTAPVSEPDFNFRSVRGSAVGRWEFRPGSALYVVWNENRAEVEPRGDFRLGRDLREIPGAPSEDVFLVKVSYWLPL